MLALGTVQFGLPYGIANKTGQIKSDQVKKILKTANSFGINTLDTAIAYGESEKVLGDAGVNGWDIITKIPEIPSFKNDSDVKKWIKSNIENSLKKLKIESIYGVLLHRPSQLIESKYQAAWHELNDLQASGLIKKIGYSIYSYKELDSLFNLFRPSLVQSPFNIFDRGIETSGWLDKLNSCGIEVHTRSCFLQGLLLMDPASRPNKFKKWTNIWDAYDEWFSNNDISYLEACLNFVLSEKRISKVVVGVDTENQLDQIISLVNKERFLNFPNFDCTDENLINPARWNDL